MYEYKKFGWVQQPYLLTKIENKFGPMVSRLQSYNTPGTPGLKILRNTRTKIYEGKHSNHCTSVEMLLYLVKHAQPGITNGLPQF